MSRDGEPAQQPSVADFDPGDGGFIENPYPAFARARQVAPVQYHPGLNMHVALSHAACDAVLRDRGLGRIWRDREPAEQFPAFNLLHRNSILECEPPTHTRLRRLVAGAFGRGHVERLRPWIAELADSLVAAARAELDDGSPSVDLLAMVAEPLPVEVIAELLGVPSGDRALLRPWSNAIVKMYEYGLGEPQRVAAERAAAEFVAYLRDLVAERRLHPGGQDGRPNDLITDLTAASDAEDGSRLSVDEVVGTSVLLLMAGHEATVNVVGNGLLALRQRPEQWQLLLERPDLTVSACEEMLRYDSALQLFERTAIREVQLGEVRIEPGQKVAALLGAANRDPEVFDRPDEVDITRAPNPHLGFGAGIHFCLGAPLARIEIQAVLDAVRARMPDLVLAEPAQRRQEFVIRGLLSLPVARAR